ASQLEHRGFLRAAPGGQCGAEQFGRKDALSPSPRAGDDLHDQVGDGAFPRDSPGFRARAIGVPQRAAEAVEGPALLRGQLGDERRWVSRSIADGPPREPQRGRAVHQTLEGTIGVGASHARGMSDRVAGGWTEDRKSTRLNSSHLVISYAVFCLKKKKD